ncbi:hypothetical protein ACRYCC_27700 [Actinomadura scrupuli]|uniref:hypothetical protein n=1 Tax=Actinomadura scrupuli TaxID=559629 RepID=UPI003D9624DE
MRRTLAVALIAATGVPMLTACSPVRRGATGMTLDAAGRPAAVVAWCPGKPPSALVLYDHNERNPDNADTTVHFTGPKPSGTYAEIPLTALPAGWTAKPSAFTITSSREYRVYAGSSDNDYTTDAVVFTTERLRPRGPATILARVDPAKPADHDVYELLTVEEFKRLAQKRGGC